MHKETLINVLFILSVVLMFTAIVFQIMNRPLEILFPIGLLAYAAGEMIKSQHKKETAAQTGW